MQKAKTGQRRCWKPSLPLPAASWRRETVWASTYDNHIRPILDTKRASPAPCGRVRRF